MPCPAGYDDLAPAFEAARAALAVPAEGTVPCNNDLLAANFIDDGERIWLIDYEYSGNNDPCFELGNIAGECGLTADALDALVTAYYGSRRRSRIARAQLFSLVSQYGWTLWGAIQHATSPLDFDFWSWAMERFEAAAAAFTSRGFRAAARPRCRKGTDAQCRSESRSSIIGGGVIGTSVAYHLTALGWTDVLLLEQGQLSCGTTWHAAGLVGQLRASEAGTRLVQYSTQLYERLEARDRPGDRVPAVRRRHRGPDPGADDCAARGPRRPRRPTSSSAS